jgi:hypothetical protein
MAGRQLLLLGIALAWPGAAQVTRFNIANYLGFENGTPGSPPPGWSSPSGAVVDGQVAHSGKNSLRIDRTASSAGSYGGIALSLPIGRSLPSRPTTTPGPSVRIRSDSSCLAVESRWIPLSCRAPTTGSDPRSLMPQ